MGRLVSFMPVDHWSGKLPEASTPAKSGAAALNSIFETRAVAFAPSGRDALDAWLGAEGLRRGDEIWITTTFDLPNVSSCVTCTIFNHCKPSRVLTPATRGIVVIHEFGVPHTHMQELVAVARSREIPLIEDCAHTIDSRASEYAAGRMGDWVLVSFPKIFPIHSGGALLSRSGEKPSILRQPSVNLESFVAEHASQVTSYSDGRRAAFARLEMTARAYGYEPLFSPSDTVSPWFFPVRTRHWRELVEALHLAKVDAASWHGSDVVVLPCHQFLSEPDFARIDAVLRSRPGDSY